MDPNTSSPFRVSEHAIRRSGTVVVACDGTDRSAGALTVGRELARALGASLEAVSVIEPTSMIVPPLARAPVPLHRGATRIRDRRERLAILCRHALADETRCATRILIGDPSSSIAGAAQAHAAHLVVTGRVPHGLVERAMRRETPLATAGAGPVPVLSVPAATRRLPRRVVVAVGRGDAAARLAPLVRAIFREALVVHLVAVVPRADVPWEHESRDEDDELRHEAERALAGAAAGWSLPADVPIETHVLEGEPGTVLAAFSEATRADLVVVGQARRSGTPHLPVAGLATRIFRTVGCAVLIVPVERHAVPALDAVTSLSLSMREWPALLREFTRRNEGRTASMSVEESGHAARHIVDSWTLSGIDCDPDACAIGIRLADPLDATRHLSHLIARPSVLAIHDAVPGRDELLVVGYSGGQITLALS